MQAQIGLPDAALKLQHHRAGAVYDRKMAGAGRFIGGRRFPVGPDEHGFPLGHFFQAVHGDEPLLLQAAQLCVVVDDGAQRIQAAFPGQEILCPGDGADHSSAEAGARIYLYA